MILEAKGLKVYSDGVCFVCGKWERISSWHRGFIDLCVIHRALCI